MENKFKQFIKDNKCFVVFYLVWFLLQFVLLALGRGDKEFWPFQKNYDNYWNEYFTLNSYGFFEFIFYMITPIVFFIIWKLASIKINNFIIFNLIWILIHIILLTIGQGYNKFWPFEWSDLENNPFDLKNYGFLEFSIYIFLPFIILVIWKIIKRHLIK